MLPHGAEGGGPGNETRSHDSALSAGCVRNPVPCVPNRTSMMATGRSTPVEGIAFDANISELHRRQELQSGCILVFPLTASDGTSQSDGAATPAALASARPIRKRTGCQSRTGAGDIGVV